MGPKLRDITHVTGSPRGDDDGPLSPRDIWVPTISAELPLSLSGRPLFPGRRRDCRDLQRSLSLGSERPGPAGARQLRGDTRRGQTSSDVITQGPRAASEVSRRNRFLNCLSFGPAFESSQYCCERCPSFSVKSEFPGHHVCPVMMSLAGPNLVMAILWGKTGI